MDISLLNPYSKEFENEFNQIKYWFYTLRDIKLQINILKESVETETKLLENMGKSILTIIKSYNNDTLVYSDEPSQLWSITSVFTGLLEIIGHLFTENMPMLNVHIKKYYNEINNDIDRLCSNISEKILFNMKELSNAKKIYKQNFEKFKRLKEEIEESHLNKKKIEQDPRSMYNITLKDKAEQKILSLLREIKDFSPIVKSQSEALTQMKNVFNSSMKESFELVINLMLVCNSKIKETFFNIKKEKFEILSEMKKYCVERVSKIRENDFSLNDYIERKYAESKNIHFDNLDSIIFNENHDLVQNLFHASDSVLFFSDNFTNLLRIRKKILKIFSKLENDYAYTLDSYSNSILKINKTMQELMQSFNYIGTGTQKTWDLSKTIYDINQKVHSNFAKIISTSIISLLNNIVKEYRNEQRNFISTWSKLQKEINFNKNILVKIQNQNVKIKNNLIQTRSNLQKLMGNQEFQSTIYKYEEKIKELLDEEKELKSSLDLHCNKYRIFMVDTINFLKKTIKYIREREFKKIGTFIDSLESMGNYYIKFLSQYLDFVKMECEIIYNIDIVEEVKEIFHKYIINYHISESYLEKNIKKSLKLLIETNRLYPNYKPIEIVENIDSLSVNNKFLSEGRKMTQNFVINVNNNNNNSEKFSPIKEIKKNVSNSNKNLTLKNEEFNAKIDKSCNESKLIDEEVYFRQDSINSSYLSSFNNIDFMKKESFHTEKNIDKYEIIKETELKEYEDKLDKFNSNNKQVIEGLIYDGLFALDPDENIYEYFSCAFEDTILLQGRLYITSKKLVFSSWFNNKTLFGETKLIIPLIDIVKIDKKYNLKIFDNSILITTKNSEMFFTSFVYRDNCFQIIKNLMNNIIKEKKQEEDMIDDYVNSPQPLTSLMKENPNSNNVVLGMNDKFTRSTQILNLLKSTKFNSWLNTKTQERIKKFEDLRLLQSSNSFEKRYINEENIGNIPPPFIFKSLFDINNVCDELDRGKNFWESLYEFRKDYDISCDNVIMDIPDYYEDLEYFNNIFIKFDENSIKELMEQVEKWTLKPSTFTFNLTHPVKKNIFGPEKVNIKEEMKIFFVSPKMFIVEVVNNSSGFPYCDSFYNTLQYIFETNIKYVKSEDTFKFISTCSVIFKITFTKSCLFRGMIETECYKESEENVRFITFDKMKTVLNNQAEQFTECFSKFNEEFVRKYLSVKSVNQNNKFNNKVSDNALPDVDELKLDNSVDEECIKIDQQSNFQILQSEDTLRFVKKHKKFFIPYILLFMCIFLKSYWVTMIGPDKIINICSFSLILFLIFYNSRKS
jgi:hypothetical protein